MDVLHVRCELLSPTPEDGRCDLAGCGKPLTGRRTRWCSNRCHEEYMANHACNDARSWCRNMARVRDANGVLLGWRCAHCKGITSRPEVNHIDPLASTGANRLRFGCHHHQSGLEVLCRSCHQQVTNAQRRLGWRAVIPYPQASLFPGHPTSLPPPDRRGHDGTRSMRARR